MTGTTQAQQTPTSSQRESQDETWEDLEDAEMEEASGDDEEEIEGVTTYTPIFCTTEVSREFFKDLEEASEGDLTWVEITTDNPAKIQDLVKDDEGTEETGPFPFKGCTVEQVYDFYREHLQPAPDTPAGEEQFTSFTFLVIDKACLEGPTQQCIICSDAPDLGEAEDEIKLKYYRVSFPQVTEHLTSIEMLTSTPRENETGQEDTIRLQPPAIYLQDDDDVDEEDGSMILRLATSGQARQQKRWGIMQYEQEGDDREEGEGGSMEEEAD